MASESKDLNLFDIINIFLSFKKMILIIFLIVFTSTFMYLHFVAKEQKEIELTSFVTLPYYFNEKENCTQFISKEDINAQLEKINYHSHKTKIKINNRQLSTLPISLILSVKASPNNEEKIKAEFSHSIKQLKQYFHGQVTKFRRVRTEKIKFYDKQDITLNNRISLFLSRKTVNPPTFSLITAMHNKDKLLSLQTEINELQAASFSKIQVSSKTNEQSLNLELIFSFLSGALVSLCLIFLIVFFKQYNQYVNRN